jgi:hypothetical protein
MRSFLYAAGIAVENKATLKNRLDHVDERVMDDTITQLGKQERYDTRRVFVVLVLP